MTNNNLYIDAYYIDPASGDDNNSGTADSPFKTIQKGVDVAGANDNDGNKVYLADGTHNLSQPIKINRYSGEEGAPLTIQSAPGEKAILDGSQISRQDSYSLIDLKNVSRIQIADLEIRNSPGHGIEVVNGDYIDIEDNLIYKTQGMGIRVRGYMAGVENEDDTTVQSSHVTIEGNEVFQTNLSNSGASKGTSNWGAGIQAWNADEVTIKDNTVGENYGEGIGLTAVDDGVVMNNYLYDNYSVQIYLDNATDSLVKNNFTFNSGDRRFYRDNFSASGIVLANEIHDIANPEQFYLNNNTITHNVVVNANTGIMYGTWAGIHQNKASKNWRGLKNTTIAHNTIYDSEFHSIKFYGDNNTNNVDISKNIFAQEKSNETLSKIDDLTGINFQSNVWFGSEPGNGFSSTGAIAEPLFVNPGGYRVTDYQLQSNPFASNNSSFPEQESVGAIEVGGDTFATGDII